MLIDNYDSFTYNLFQYLSELGESVVVVRNDKATIGEIERMKPERIVVSPGPSTPQNAGISNDVIRHFGASIPILGVCLGHQCIGYSYRWEGWTGQSHNARQVIPDTPQRPGGLCWLAQSLSSHSLPLLDCGKGRTARMPGGDRLDRRRQHHGAEASRAPGGGRSVPSRVVHDGER